MGLIVDGRIVKREAGAGTAQPELVGTLSVNTATVGNVGAGEDDLMTYPLPAKTLADNGRGVRVTAWGDAANNANAKTLKVYFGATEVLSTALTASQVGTWRVVMEVIRTGAATQVAIAQLNQGGATTIVDAETDSPTSDLDAAVTIKLTGTATANDDIRQFGMVVEAI